MRTLNAFEISDAPGSPGRLPNTFDFPDKMRCSRIILDITVPVKNTRGTDMAYISFSDCLAALIGAFSLSFGNKAKEIVDNAITFADLRRMHVLMMDREFLTQSGTYSFDTGYQSHEIWPAGATKTFRALIVRPFEFQNFSGSRIQTWCPGADQMRQMSLSIIRGGAFPTDLAQDGPASVTVRAGTLDGDANGWVRPPRWEKNQDSGLEQRLPGGALLALTNTVPNGNTSTGLGLVSLGRDGDADLYTDQEADDLLTDQFERSPLGSVDPVMSGAAVLFGLESKASMADVPTASGYTVRQQTSGATMMTAALIAPPTDQPWADSYVAPNLVDVGPVKLTVPATNDTSGHTAAVSGVSVLRAFEPSFELNPGRVYARGRPASTHIPQAVIDSVKAAVNNANSGVAPSTLASATAQVAKRLPGGTSPQRGTATPLGQEVLRAMAPNAGIAAQTNALLTQVR